MGHLCSRRCFCSLEIRLQTQQKRECVGPRAPSWECPQIEERHEPGNLFSLILIPLFLVLSDHRQRQFGMIVKEARPVVNSLLVLPLDRLGKLSKPHFLRLQINTILTTKTAGWPPTRRVGTGPDIFQAPLKPRDLFSPVECKGK